MRIQSSYNPEYVKKVSLSIRDNIFSKIFQFKSHVFLCGGAKEDDNTARSKIELFFSSFYGSWFNLIYPEDIFEDLLSGRGSLDLLSLENILAESVDVIIIIPESPGSFAELGAFVNSQKLRRKIICVQDNAHKKSKSFINYGPIKLMKSTKEGKVLFLNLDKIKNTRHIYDVESRNECMKVFSAIRQISKGSKKRLNIANLLQAENFILPCVYLLEAVRTELLIDLVKYGSGVSSEEARTTVLSSLTILSKKNVINQSPEGFKLTDLGISRFQRMSEKRNHFYAYSIDEMDKIRIDILSLELRNKQPKLI